jgi:hypothetical protein
VLVQSHDGFFEFQLERFQLGVEGFDLVLPDQTDAGLWIRQRHRLPQRDDAALYGCHGLVGFVLGVEQLLACR